MSNVFSQLELKLEPINLLFGQIPISIEYILTDNMGVEGTIGYSFQKDRNFENAETSTGLVINGLFKYYFNPDNGGDKFYVFPFVRNVNRSFTFTEDNVEYKSTYKAFGVGFGVGYKVVARAGLVFDFGLGVGKNFTSEYTYEPAYTPTEEFTLPITGIFRASLGYRFGGVKQEVEKK